MSFLELPATAAAPSEVDLSSVSGDVICRLDKRYANSLGINNVSGNIELVLAAGGDAYYRFGSISGGITIRPSTLGFQGVRPPPPGGCNNAAYSSGGIWQWLSGHSKPAAGVSAWLNHRTPEE